MTKNAEKEKLSQIPLRKISFADTATAKRYRQWLNDNQALINTLANLTREDLFSEAVIAHFLSVENSKTRALSQTLDLWAADAFRAMESGSWLRATQQVLEEKHFLLKEKDEVLRRKERLHKDGGRKRGETQSEEKRQRYEQILKAESDLKDLFPSRALNKEIAKATGLATDYVRKARREMKEK